MTTTNDPTVEPAAVRATGSGPTMSLAEVQQRARGILEAVATVIDGKDGAISTALTVLLAEGHLLIEDVPGVGKTQLARALAKAVDATVTRIQFTPDLLPSDITGVSVYDRQSGGFEFKPGPVFANVVIGDEINRASPKTQSALLEVMEEGIVTIDGTSYEAGKPFMVIATQNPIEQAGTYKLPEAQLDRFLIKTTLGYPDRQTSVNLLLDASNRARATKVQPIIGSDAVITMAQLATEVHVDGSILEYVADVVAATRDDQDVALGVSMRGALALVRAVKTWAISQGRTYVTPDDVNDLAQAVLAHRIIIDPESDFAGVTAQDVVARVLVSIAPPAYRAA